MSAQVFGCSKNILIRKPGSYITHESCTVVGVSATSLDEKGYETVTERIAPAAFQPHQRQERETYTINNTSAPPLP